MPPLRTAMQSIIDFEPNLLVRVGGGIAALWLLDTILPKSLPDPEADKEIYERLEVLNLVLVVAGLPQFPVGDLMETPREGRLYQVFNYGPIRFARTILAVVAPATLCFALLSPERKRAIASPVNWQYMVPSVWFVVRNSSRE